VFFTVRSKGGTSFNLLTKSILDNIYDMISDSENGKKKYYHAKD
jgi:hypothetical protein